PPYRDAAIILIDQLKEIYIAGELEPVDTVQWYPKVMRGDYTAALNLTGNGIDDPDQTMYENFTCGAEGNYDRYCNPELDKMVDRQSMEFDQKKRKEMVWAIERKLAEDAARPILWHNRTGTCWRPYVTVDRCIMEQSRIERARIGHQHASCQGPQFRQTHAASGSSTMRPPSPRPSGIGTIGGIGLHPQAHDPYGPYG